MSGLRVLAIVAWIVVAASEASAAPPGVTSEREMAAAPYQPVAADSTSEPCSVEFDGEKLGLPTWIRFADDEKCTPRSECCKICSKGKACGDSCISRSYACRKAKGCACDSKDVCDQSQANYLTALLLAGSASPTLSIASASSE